MPWRQLLIASVALAACRRPQLQQVTDTIDVGASLDFGVVPLGETASRPLDVHNRTVAAVELALSADAPFSAPASVTLPGGATQSIALGFHPSALGPVEQLLTVKVGELVTTVRLSGIGAAACAARDTCHGVYFDADAGVCTDTVLADGTACTSACLEQGTCRAGTCMGAFAACDDGDACTVDACGEDGGCLHLPRVCPIDDPCAVAACDPSRGCSSAPVADGTACGERTCATAHICLGGACTERATPNADTDCRYVSVCATESYSCASTSSGKLRCWGSAPRLGKPGRVAAPHTVVGASQVAVPLCDFHRPLWLDRAGRLQPIDPFALDDAGLSTIAEARDLGFDLTVLDVDGTVASTNLAGTAAVRVAGGVAHLEPSGCLDLTDGGLQCDGAPAGWAGAISASHAAALVPTGAVIDRDGGTIAVGAQALGDVWTSDACWYSAGVVSCRADTNQVVWPDPPLALTRQGRAMCGVSDAGGVTCWGQNVYGETGDPGVAPEGLVRFGDGGFRLMGLRELTTVALRGDELWVAGLNAANLDGTAATSDAGVDESSLRSSGHFAGVTALNGYCVLQGGTMSCWFVSGPLRVSGTDIVTLCSASPCGIDRLGRELCYGQAAPVATGLDPQGPCIDADCRKGADGGVGCKVNVMGGAMTTVPVALSAAPTLLSTGQNQACAVVLGQVYCWPTYNHWNYGEVWDGGVLTPTFVPGVRQPVRLLRADRGYACAVSGLNGLQCWEPGGAAVDLAIAAPIIDVQLAGTGGVFGPHACALLQNGELRCWGANNFGQLGFVPNTGQRPVKVVR